MRKGSITIFALLSMMLVASMLLALLEASRFHQIKGLANLQTQVALESVFAEYNTYLWEEYRILACSQKSVLEKVESYGNEQIVEKNEGINFFQFRVKDTELNGYTRLTDGDGTAFIQAAAAYMEDNFLYETAKNIYGQYEGIREIQSQSQYSFQDVANALNQLKDSQNQRTRKQSRNSVNILEWIQTIYNKGVLSLVLEEESAISEKSIDVTDKVSERKMPESYNPTIEEVNWYTRVLFQQYMLTYLSNYRNDKKHALDYEVEYVLMGKDSDIENLKGTITQLMTIRAVCNFLYLSNSVTRQEQAGGLAISIAGASANPILIEIVKTAIVTAWAFAESILDVRTLLSGGKISLLKSDNSWTLDIDAITKLEEDFLKAKNCNDGLEYKDYMGILLLLQDDNTMAMRVMDVQEETLREKYENESICMEDWITEAKVSVRYQYQPVFFSIEKVIPSWNYEIFTEERFSY